jgi:ferrochelatase
VHALLASDSERAVRDALATEPDRILLLPPLPAVQRRDDRQQRARGDAGSRSSGEGPRARDPLVVRPRGYLDAMAARVRKALASLPAARAREAFVLYSAHSLPMKIVEKGDPYPKEIEATVAGIRARLGIPNPWALSFQSRVGPIRWLTPSTEGKVVEIGAEGTRASSSCRSASSPTTSRRCTSSTSTSRSARARTASRASYGHPRSTTGADFLDALADVVRRSLAKEIAA